MKRSFPNPALLLGALGVAGVVGLAAACSVPDAPAATEPPVKEVPVRLAAVRREKVTPPVHASGRIGYAAETRLAFKVGGVVARMLVDEGAHVRRGQVLARLDPREIDAQLSSAESARTKAERDLERARVLRREDVVPGEVLENATTAAEVARAGADAARFNRRFSEVRAPADGVVLARLVEPGEVVGPGTPVLMMGAADAARAGADRGAGNPGRTAGRVVRIGVADRDVVRLAIGDPATIRLDALPGQTLAGAVDEIAPTATPTTGSFEVTVRITGPAAGPGAAAGAGPVAGARDAEVATLAAGLVAEVELQPRATRELTTIPLAALVDADGARGRVFAVAADRRHAVARPVDIAFLTGDRVALTGGLDGVSQVVSDGASYLDERSVLVVVP
ncbi:MAG TPA: efflux RND transporter periplasmic adaptor subunit [Kofleriaceae bacterium]|nr:efflux RND transporter periplasmic adaptor subunit [Kofleriaceae bacterium]